MGTITERPDLFRNAGGLQGGVVDPVTVASTTAMPAPNALVSTVSGTVEITTIAVPWPGFTGVIKYIPTGAFTGATGGTATSSAKPIGKAFTAVAGKVLELVCDGSTWYPSYTS